MTKFPVFPSFVEHSEYTDIDLVGLQVWNGALLLADFIIHENQLFAKKRVLELSSGTGLVSLVVSLFCGHVTCTGDISKSYVSPVFSLKCYSFLCSCILDIDEGHILPTIRSNFKRNENLVNSTFTVEEYDFFKVWSADIQDTVDNTEIILVSEGNFLKSSCFYE